MVQCTVQCRVECSVTRNFILEHMMSVIAYHHLCGHKATQRCTEQHANGNTHMTPLSINDGLREQGAATSWHAPALDEASAVRHAGGLSNGCMYCGDAWCVNSHSQDTPTLNVAHNPAHNTSHHGPLLLKPLQAQHEVLHLSPVARSALATSLNRHTFDVASK